MNASLWDPYFYQRSPAFKDLLPLWKQVENKFDTWPNAADFNQIANHEFRFIPQEENMHYIWEIYENNLIPMRQENWHDFFNNLTWIIWPKLKKAINTRICQETAHQQNKNRTALQNVLAHFDENGAVICYEDQTLIEYIKEFQWKELFWNRENLCQHLQCILVGHGLFEKLLSPFLGITAKVIFLKVPDYYFDLSHPAQLSFVDDHISDYIMTEDFPHSPRALQPFPLLGWPHWYPGNRIETFYDNQQYFRPLRHSRETPLRHSRETPLRHSREGGNLI